MLINLKITNYLDIWRGASYSLILSVFIIQIVSLNGVIPDKLILALCIVAFYIVMDSSVRFYSREKIRGHIAESDKVIRFFKHSMPLPIFEFLIFFLELLGLVFIANSIKFTKNIGDHSIFELAYYDKAFFIFLLTVVFYNFLQIGASTNKSIWRYFLIVFSQNSLNIESVRKNWLNSYVVIQRTLIENIIREFNHLEEIAHKKDDAAYEFYSKLLNKDKRKFKYKKLTTHLATQLTSFHLVILNLIFSILYYIRVYHPYLFNYLHLEYNVHNIIIVIASILTLSLLTIIFYHLISCSEVRLISKLISENNDIDAVINAINPEVTKLNAICQALGNIFYLLLIICIYLIAISYSFIDFYLVVVFQQMAVSFILLLEK